MLNIRIPDFIFYNTLFYPVTTLREYACCSGNSGTSWGPGI